MGETGLGRTIEEARAVLAELSQAEGELLRVAELAAHACKTGRQILVCGNGGSAADAQHFAAELVGLSSLRALSLTVDTSALTALANDHGYASVFARQLKALAARGDVLLCISTSGGSENVLAAAGAARELGVTVVGLTGADGGRLAPLCDVTLRVPSRDTMRIQEAHTLLLHVLWQEIHQRCN